MTAHLYGALFELMGVFCHQMPDRSWIVLGEQAPLCIRCCAVSFGALAATCYLFMRYAKPSLRLSVLLAAPLFVDVGAQAVGLYDGNNWVRFATGFSFGFFSLMGSLGWLAGWAQLSVQSGRGTTPLSIAKTS